MAIETDEFSYLPHQAQALDVPLPAVRRRTLALPDGRSLSALQYGTGDPVVTLLHGAGLNAHTWDTTALMLGVPALAIDLAGHGDSSWREDLDYTAHPLSRDVIAALEAWTTTPQILVGQSLGGLTAAAVAARRPELARSLVIVDITPGIDTSAGPAALRDFYAGPTDFADRDELVERALSFGFGGERAATERGVFLNTRVREDGRIEWKHHFAHLAARTLGIDGAQTAARPSPEAGWEDLAEVTAPIALIRASAGFVSEADGAEFLQRLPDAELTVMTASHNVQETAPADLAELIRTRIAAAR
ncbi:alpha/beta hydrolase [uncultured Microbacterium sp.]|uniref:alpha/beta fold hydrolase n=1 Tax=uncultured Microbacterium sp. TaxID=191216 RepID=UPI0026224234|nr:alpha/beta hydrolase [uncultured Microbacterium sp.]